jgi:hypothetical protein
MVLALWSLLFANPLCPGLKQLLWGDTHLHTSYPTDAYSNSNPTIDPATACRQAQRLGEVNPLWLGTNGQAQEQVIADLVHTSTNLNRI